MKTADEIERRITELVKDIVRAEADVASARESYTQAIRLFGIDDSDRGQLEYAQEILRDLIVRKETLEWVLRKDS